MLQYISSKQGSGVCCSFFVTESTLFDAESTLKQSCSVSYLLRWSPRAAVPQSRRIIRAAADVKPPLAAPHVSQPRSVVRLPPFATLQHLKGPPRKGCGPCIVVRWRGPRSLYPRYHPLRAAEKSLAAIPRLFPSQTTSSRRRLPPVARGCGVSRRGFDRLLRRVYPCQGTPPLKAARYAHFVNPLRDIPPQSS